MVTMKLLSGSFPTERHSLDESCKIHPMTPQKAIHHKAKAKRLCPAKKQKGGNLVLEFLSMRS